MADSRTYHEQTTIDYTLRLREILKTLPGFAKDFFRAIIYFVITKYLYSS